MSLIRRSIRAHGASVVATLVSPLLVAALGASVVACDDARDAEGVPERRSQAMEQSEDSPAGSDRPDARGSAAIWTSTSAPYTVTWSDTNLVVRSNRREVISLRRILGEAMEGAIILDSSETVNGAVCEEEYRYRVLSFVAGILSVGEYHYSYCSDAAHPSLYEGFHAIDLARTEREGLGDMGTVEGIGLGAKLTSVFPEQEVIDALMADKLVRTRLGPNPKRPATADELVEMLEGGTECEYSFDRDLLTRWAIHHVEGKRVAVRIGLSHGCEAARGRLTQIGILLKIPAKILAAVRAADAGREGILMEQSAKRFDGRNALMKWRYTTDADTTTDGSEAPDGETGAAEGQ